ncbi:MAG: hypothetical protein JEZ08_25215 [Clostridiales bacterium]|nr:hypothetical protein [Clostridiales bacterium]
MKVIKILTVIIGLFCILLGLLTPLSSVLLSGIGIMMILISAALPKTLVKIKRKLN